MRRIELIATDLDGTLVGNGEGPEHFSQFQRALRGLRQRFGTRWALITGRHLGALQPVLHQYFLSPIVPDYVVVEDARIYRCGSRRRLRPLLRWNLCVDGKRLWLGWRHRRRLEQLCSELTEMFPEARDLSRPGVDIWLKLPDMEQTRAVQEALTLRSAPLAGSFMVMRWGTEVCLGSAVGTKGEALAKLSREMRIDRRHVFAVGDGANDVSMLNGRAAAMPACVGNASSEVRGTVRGARGHVADGTGLSGVLEALEVYQQRERDPS